MADDSLKEVLCPSCGSHFQLLSDQSTSPHPATPRRIAHFELLSQVGIGHFGAVWKARDIELDRIVALKIPRASHLDERDVESFLREARAAAQVKHPNIVNIHEVGREDGNVFIVSDFIEGANLKEYLSGQGLSFREVAALCITIGDALHAAHEAGVVHRDLKPQNIMVDAQGTPYVADFGLAKREAGEITMTVDGQILGTPAYMPPEQIGAAHYVDRRADVYSLGVVLFELLTGELPFRGQRQMLLLQIQRDDPDLPRKLNNKIPRDLETICLKAMAKEPSRRYQTAAEFAADLRRWLSGVPVLARPVGDVERAWRWCRRHPATVTALAAVPVAIAVAATLVALAVRSDRFANDLVAIVVLVPLLAVGTALMSVSVLVLPFGIGLLFRRAWQRIKRRATAATPAGPIEHQMIFENLPVTSLTPETILRLTSRALQGERALRADPPEPQWNLRQFLLGAMVSSGLLAALVSIAVCSPGLRPWSTAHFRIVLAPIVVFMCTLVAIGATKVRRS